MPPSPVATFASATTERLALTLCLALVGWVVLSRLDPTPAQTLIWAGGLIALWLCGLLAHGRWRMRRRATAERADSTLALIGRHLPLVIWVVDGGGVVRSVHGDNPTGGGLHARDLLHRSIEALTADSSQFAALVQQVRSGHRCSGEAEIDGVPYLHHLLPRAEDGDFFGFTCISEDLSSARSQTASGQLWRALFDQVGDAILVLDHERRVVAANPGVTRITGHEIADVVGRRDRLLLSPPMGGPDAYQAIFDQLQRKDVWEGETMVRHKSGQLCEVRMVACVVRAAGGRIANYVVMFADLSQAKRAQEELRHLATHDNLTDLPNRRLFLDRLDQGIRRARREQRQLVVLFVDIDNFKTYNDTYGHLVGDAILREVGHRLRAAVRQSDTVARLAGDEFTVLADSLGDESEALVAKIDACFGEPFPVEERMLQVSASVGVAVYPRDGVELEELMQHADRLMYQAKARTRLPSGAEERRPRPYEEGLYFPSELRLAIRRGQLNLVYQPQLDLVSGRPVAAEALLRWEHHCRGNINPLEFMGLAEESGITEAIGTWTLGQVAKQIKAWRRWDMPIRQAAINVAISQVKDSRYPQLVADVLAQHGLAPDAVMLELQEQDYLSNPGLCRIFLERARSAGLRLCIDQFGATTTRYEYVSELPVDAVKLNPKSLGPIDGRTDPRLLPALVALCRVAGKSVMAVGIERSIQETELIAAGCTLGQGFLYSPPLTPEALRTFRPEDRAPEARVAEIRAPSAHAKGAAS